MNSWCHNFLQPLRDMSSNNEYMRSQSSYYHEDSRPSSINFLFDTKGKFFLAKFRSAPDVSGSQKLPHAIKGPTASSVLNSVEKHEDHGRFLSNRDRHHVHILQKSLDRQEHNSHEVHPNYNTPIPNKIYVPHSYPLQMRPLESDITIPPSVPDHDYSLRYCETVGNPSLNIHRFRLPSQFLSILDYVVHGCERYAQSLPNGWNTELYSLTKQDISLRDIPHLYDSVIPIVSYIKKAIAMVYGVNSLRMDRNQPHVLKYKWEKNGKGHTGVQLHHDKCDYTINLMLSRSSDYGGGGTFFPDAHRLVRLEFGEFLIHPGSCVHGGAPINAALINYFENSTNTLTLFQIQIMINEGSEPMEKVSLPSAPSSLIPNLLESVIEQTLENLENHPNIYSITDLNRFSVLSNKLNERIHIIQKKLSHSTGDTGIQINHHPSSTSMTIEDKGNDRETDFMDHYSRETTNGDEKSNNSIKAQHEQGTLDVITRTEAKERKRFQFIRRNISSIFPEQRKIKALEDLITDKSDPAADGDDNDNWKQIAVDAFKIIDKNGDGFLQREEVIAAIKVIGDQGMDISGGSDPAEVADIMMKDVDLDGDGLIDINEFVEMMRRNVDAEKGSTKKQEFNHRMSQLARNVLQAHQKKIENNVIGRDLWMIHPYGNTHAVWDTLVSFLILLNVITMPLCLGWEEVNSHLFVLNLVVDIIFLFDVWKNFCTGIVDENDAIIMDKQIVRRQYLTGFFIPDLLSSIPLDLILKWSGQSGSNIGAVSNTKNTLKMLKVMRLAKLFRLLRINRLFRQLKEMLVWIEDTLHFHVSEGFMKMLRLGIFALVMGHWIGCFNFMLVRLNNFPRDSWAVYAGLKDQDAFTQWSWSFFKALSEMIMLGFQTPPFTNSSCDAISEWCTIENWVTLLCLYLGAVFYSLLISSVSSILETANIANRHFEEKLIQLDDYMRSKRLPSTLREKVKDYFHIIHSKGKLYNENEIHSMLTPILSRQIKVFTGKELAVKVPLLSAIKNHGFAEEISTMIEPMIVFENEIILRERTTGDEMFFISSGVVEIFITNKEKVVSYIAIGDGCYFGEVSLLLGMQRTASAKTKTQCMLYRLSKVKFMVALHDYPETLEFMKRVAEKRLRRLQHFVNPAKVPFRVDDEVDEEDSKTELFGVDTSKLVHVKEEEATKARTRKMSKRYATILKHPLPISIRR